VRRGTLRGIHYQALPEPETRLVRATRGSAFAVVVDLRAGLRSFGRHFSCMLTESGGTMLYVPQGCGLGYQTMTDGTELFYQMSSRYRPALARGVRWNDPALAISWPLPPVCMSARDARLPTLRELEPALA
jgi:dTDP-4-dehydrorhamnose 3,5-epimerase